MSYSSIQSRYQSGVKFSDNEVSFDEALKNSLGQPYAYLATISYRLSLLLLKHPELCNAEVAVQCTVLDEIFKKHGKLSTSTNGRIKGVNFKSTAISSNISSTGNTLRTSPMITFYNGSDYSTKINLSALNSGLEMIHVNYGELIVDKEEQGRDGATVNTRKVNSMINTPECERFIEHVESGVTGHTNIPEITRVFIPQRGVKDNRLIAWFEPYDPSKLKQYKAEAIDLRNQYINLLENNKSKGNKSKGNKRFRGIKKDNNRGNA